MRRLLGMGTAEASPAEIPGRVPATDRPGKAGSPYQGDGRKVDRQGRPFGDNPRPPRRSWVFPEGRPTGLGRRLEALAKSPGPAGNPPDETARLNPGDRGGPSFRDLRPRGIFWHSFCFCNLYPG